MPGQPHVCNAANCVDVSRPGRTFRPPLLRCSEGRREAVPQSVQRRGVLNESSNTEVSDLPSVLVKQHISGLQIAMDDVQDLGKPRYDLAEDWHGLGDAEGRTFRAEILMAISPFKINDLQRLNPSGKRDLCNTS